jgi:DNA polymerase-1
VGQNLKYDQHVLANHGLVLRGVVHDTLLQSYVLEAHRPHDMDNLAWRHLSVKTIAYTDVTGKGAKQIEFDQVGIAEATAYSAEDADIALQLHRRLYPSIAADPKLERIYTTIEMPVREVLYGMERDGVMLDAALLSAQEPRARRQGHGAGAAGIPACGPAVQPRVAEAAGRDPLRQDEAADSAQDGDGQPSTDEDVLTMLAADYPLPKILLEHRALSKLKSTYTDKLPQMVNPGPAACTRRSARPRRSPAGSRRSIPICRTFPCARLKAGASARPLSRLPEA